jgi:hypothetical protein
MGTAGQAGCGTGVGEAPELDVRQTCEFRRDFVELGHDPEKWNRFSEKIMLKQRDGIMMRFHLIAS